jgi:NTE family protein
MAEWFKKITSFLHKASEPQNLGLALGGGGVRGLAHIGVLTVLDREKIPIHAIAGTSMGAIVGAAYGLSKDFDRERLTQLVIDLGFKPALPLGVSERDHEGWFEYMRRFLDVERFLIDTMWGWGPFERKVVVDALEKLTSGKNLEDSKVPLVTVATDLLSGDKVVFRKGPASLALQASSALPGFFPPVKYEGKLLADGAFVDLVPTDVVRDMGATFIVAVDVDQEVVHTEISNGLQAFLRAADIGARHHKHHHLKLADLVIRPEFGEDIDAFDFSKVKLCVDAGVRAAERALPVLLRVLKLNRKQ